MTGTPNGKDPTSSLGGCEGDWIWAPAGDPHPPGEFSENVRKKYTSAFNMMTSLDKNGIVMNKLLTWMDIQKDTPPDTWKAHLKTLYTDEEILEAKTALFDGVGGESTRIGEFKKHNIKTKHLEDLIEAVDKLWNNNEMPLLIASSKMIKTMRNYNMVDDNKVNIADAVNKMKELENTVKACL